MHQLKFLGSEFYGKHSSLDSCFPSLETLRFEDMPNWEEWSCLTTEVEVAGHFPRLRNLYISRCSNLKTVATLHLPLLCELELRECNMPIIQRLTTLTSLRKLQMENIGGITSLDEAFVQFPVALEVLDICSCNELVSLWQNGDTVQDLVHLQSIKIMMCPQIMSLEEIRALPTLRNLHVVGCNSLEILPRSMSSLEELKVESCSSLKSSEMRNLTSALRHLEVNDYTNTDLISRTMLEDSSVTLEHLEFSYCPNLNVRELLGSVHHFRNLYFVLINGCDCLESFPEGGLPIPKLAALLIGNCKNLKSLPNRMETFSCLEILTIYDCPSIESFPQSELPPNLISLCISNCGKLKPLSEWSHRCTSLHNLKIWQDTYPELLSFSRADTEECLLPPNLRVLHIGGLPNLESLSKGLEKLTSLCHLRIWDCPKLYSLPKDNLLDKLWSLKIESCPLLEKRCLKNRGDYWSMIRDIPCVKIGNIPIYGENYV